MGRAVGLLECPLVVLQVQGFDAPYPPSWSKEGNQLVQTSDLVVIVSGRKLASENPCMLIPQIEVTQYFQGHAAIGRDGRCVLASMQIRGLIQVSLQCLLRIGSKVVGLPSDFLAVLARRM